MSLAYQHVMMKGCVYLDLDVQPCMFRGNLSKHGAARGSRIMKDFLEVEAQQIHQKWVMHISRVFQVLLSAP